jgi:hypothetical protein
VSDGAPITRRSFLRRTLLGAALLAVGGTLARHLTGYHLDEAVAGRLRVLSPKEALVFLAVARRLLAPDAPAPGAAPAPSLDEVDVLGSVDAYLAGLPEHLAADVRALLQLVEHSPAVFSLRMSRYTRLPPSAQDEVLAGWAASRLDVRRQGFAALKALAAIGYYGDPRTHAVLGYVPMQLPR